MTNERDVLWRPEQQSSSEMSKFVSWLTGETGRMFESYADLWEFSTRERASFWKLAAAFLDVRFHDQPRCVLTDAAMPYVEWFPGATLNYAEHALRGEGDRVVLEAISESRPSVSLTRQELRDEVDRVAAILSRLGVHRGDRVVAYLPNIPEAIVALLATASIGAIFASCAPELRVGAVINRLGQLAPKVLIAVNGYRYGGDVIDRTPDVQEIRRQLTTLEATIHVSYLAGTPALPDSSAWDEQVERGVDRAGSDERSGHCIPMPFEHPLYVLFTSGTTGLPKAVVHGHGSMVLEHLKWLKLHADIRASDKVLWPSNTSWMAWNASVSVLLCGAGLVQFDGSPTHPTLEHFWAEVASLGVTYLGTSPAFINLCQSNNVVPRAIADMSAVRGVLSGGSPLSADGFRWIYKSLHPNVFVQSASGGTEFCSSFVGGAPILPVTAGRIACRMLGASVASVDEWGREVKGSRGELVIDGPMPSMPLQLWGDDGAKSRLRSSYLERFPGRWDHGDWITVFEDGSCVISGRSDATLNRGGVRLGTAEFYSVLESSSAIVDALVVHVEEAEGLGAIVLFVVTKDGDWDDSMRAAINEILARELSPRYRPDEIYAVTSIPKNAAGKKLEIPVKRILSGEPADDFLSSDVVVNPDSMREVVAIALTRRQDLHVSGRTGST